MDLMFVWGSIAYSLVSASTIPIFARRYIRGRSFHMLPTKTSTGGVKFKVTPGPREELLPAKDVPAMVDAAYEAAAFRSVFWPLTLIAHFSDGVQAKTRKRLIDETASEELGRYRTALALLAYRAGQEDEPLMARIAAAEDEAELRACERLLRGESEVPEQELLPPPQARGALAKKSDKVTSVTPPPGHRWTAAAAEVGTSYETVVISLVDQDNVVVKSGEFYIHVYKTPESQQKQVLKLQEELVAQFYSTGEVSAEVLRLVGQPSALDQSQEAPPALIAQGTPLPLTAVAGKTLGVARKELTSAGKTPILTKAARYGFGRKPSRNGFTHD